MSKLQLARADVEIVVTGRPLLAPGRKIRFRSLDVGVGGLRLRSSQPFPTGACMHLEFRLPNSPLPLRGEVQVRFCREEDGEHILGVAFVDNVTRRNETVLAFIQQTQTTANREPRRGWLTWLNWAPLSLFK